MKKLIYPLLTGMLLFSSPAPAEPIGMPTRSTPDITANTRRANALFDQAFDALIERRPISAGRGLCPGRRVQVGPGESRHAGPRGPAQIGDSHEAAVQVHAGIWRRKAAIRKRVDLHSPQIFNLF